MSAPLRGYDPGSVSPSFKRKPMTPNDFGSLTDVEEWLLGFQHLRKLAAILRGAGRGWAAAYVAEPMNQESEAVASNLKPSASSDSGQKRHASSEQEEGRRFRGLN